MQFDVVKDQIKSEILLQKMNKLAKEEADAVFDQVKTDSQFNKSLRKVVLPFRGSEIKIVINILSFYNNSRESCFHMNCK